MQYLLRRVTASLPTLAAGPQPGLWNNLYRRTLLVVALVAFLAHVIVMAARGWSGPGALSSNLLQVILGILAVLALVEAGRSTSGFGRRVWFFAALGVAVYSMGQAILTYGITFHRQPQGPHLTDSFFFFWMVPLIAAAAADPGTRKGFDWPAILDFTQLVLLAIALHFFVFGDPGRWQTQAEQMGFLKWKVRLIRDAVVLACLWGRALVSSSHQIRAVFLRLGGFYLAYTLAGAIYLYAEARLHMVPGATWFDLLWSTPRLLAVVLALTWNRRSDDKIGWPAADWRRRCMVLYWAPALVPLAILVLGSRMLPTAPALWSGLIVAAFGLASARLMITQFGQEQALERQRSSNNLLHSIVEGTSEVIYLKDAQGRYRLINRAGARHLGLSPKDVVGKADRDLFSTETAEFILRGDQKVLRSGQPLTVEETLTANGATRTFLSTKNPYRDASGQIGGVLGVAVDITERRVMEEQLRRAQRMESIGTFSGGIAHDFNNLLTVIKGYSQLALVVPEADAETTREYVEQISKAAGRASSLIDQLLAFSRRQILKPRIISLNDVVSSLQRMLPRLIGEDVEVQTNLSVELGPVKADPGQMEQVLMNLAANARDAMPAGGKLTVETANVRLRHSAAGSPCDIPPGDYALLAVSDTGSGMDLQTQARIFEPFFTTKPPGKGTGLGLATVYGIVKQTGGYIWVESRPGCGTTFKLYFPRVSGMVEGPSPNPAPLGQHKGNQTILLVDDDQQLRQFANTVLTQHGFTVLEAENADQAGKIGAGYAGSIDLLLTDVVMPGANGREVARRICDDRRETQVLFMSGYTGDTMAHHGVLDAGVSFLPKPFSPARLVEKVSEVLSANPRKAVLKEIQ